jgi:hypothetical protein
MAPSGKNSFAKGHRREKNSTAILSRNLICIYLINAMLDIDDGNILPVCNIV